MPLLLFAFVVDTDTTASYVQFSDEEQRKWYDDLWKDKEEVK